jgi:ATP-binding cassette subfamily F protein uup
VPKPRRIVAAKMNFADAHALKTLPEKIAATDILIVELEKNLSDSGLYAKDPKRFADLSARLVKIRAEKEADEEHWLTLEMQREALETQPD